MVLTARVSGSLGDKLDNGSSSSRCLELFFISWYLDLGPDDILNNDSGTCLVSYQVLGCGKSERIPNDKTCIKNRVIRSSWKRFEKIVLKTVHGPEKYIKIDWILALRLQTTGLAHSSNGRTPFITQNIPGQPNIKTMIINNVITA